MSELLGIIAPLKKFLSNTDEVIKVPFSKDEDNGLQLLKGRKYVVPDFQREIRWDADNIAQLIDDISSGPKYLGNVILTKISNEEFLIIDGQQRTTVLTMILACIKRLHSECTDTIIPCPLEIQSFTGFSKILTNNFPDMITLDKSIHQSDKLHQIKKYYSLWSFINTYPSITSKQSVQLFIENLEKSNVNIILNTSEDPKDGIRYFIDVNLKGKQLDVEDIFKSHLFRKDSSKEIRDAWYEFKTYASQIEQSKKINYPLLQILEHYFYCDLYKEARFKGLIFGKDFLLEKEYRDPSDPKILFRSNTHLIEVISNKKYMLNSICNINRILKIMINIVVSDSLTEDFKELFVTSQDTMDNTELKVIHNFLKKILNDDKMLPKALVMKYIMTNIIDGETKSKKIYREVYGVYLLSVLFTIFENKKSIEVLLSVLKSTDEKWYEELIKQVNSYFSSDKITDTRLLAQYKLGKNEEEENYKFRCKSLATIYNYLTINGNEVKVKAGQMQALCTFVTDDTNFSMEHFIVSENNKKETIIVANGCNQKYTYDESFYKKYVNNLFNFIFIDENINTKLSNNWLPKKIDTINGENLQCEYSKMIISELREISQNMNKLAGSNYKNDLDLYFARDFKEQYIEYAKNVLNKVILKINGRS